MNNIAALLYDLSEHQIAGVKKNFVTDYKVEEIKESMRDLILAKLPKEMVRRLVHTPAEIYAEGFAEGFNNAVSEIHKKISELFE